MGGVAEKHSQRVLFENNLMSIRNAAGVQTDLLHGHPFTYAISVPNGVAHAPRRGTPRDNSRQILPQNKTSTISGEKTGILWF